MYKKIFVADVLLGHTQGRVLASSNQTVKLQKISDRLRQTGEFRLKNHIQRPKIISVEEEDEILVRIAQEPGLGTRRLLEGHLKVNYSFSNGNLHFGSEDYSENHHRSYSRPLP